MGDTNGQPGPLGALLTTETRWFFEGAIPLDVLFWFVAADSATRRERRTDTYDLDSAQLGIGVKRRGSGGIESKSLVSATRLTEPVTGITGKVEEWMKVSRPLEEVTDWADRRLLAIEKEIVSRRYRAGGTESDPFGCELELAAITAGSVEAWTICIETFGPSADRFRAFQAGIAGLVDLKPFPAQVSLEASNSVGYPEWIMGRVLDPDAPAIASA